MAATETINKIAVKMLLNAGTTASGDVKTVSSSLPTLSLTGYTPERAMAVTAAWEACLSKSIYSVQAVKTAELSA